MRAPAEEPDPVALAASLLRRHQSLSDSLLGIDPDEASDPGDLLAVVAAAAGDCPASSPLGQLGAAVAAGETSWAEVWEDPAGFGRAGLDLVAAVLRRAALPD